MDYYHILIINRMIYNIISIYTGKSALPATKKYSEDTWELPGIPDPVHRGQAAQGTALRPGSFVPQKQNLGEKTLLY